VRKVSDVAKAGISANGVTNFGDVRVLKYLNDAIRKRPARGSTVVGSLI
jgi:hypothetical protein